MRVENPPQARQKLEPLRSLLLRLDCHALWLLPLYAAFYLAAVLPFLQRPLWYDELFTYYVSTSASLTQFLDRVFHVDLNPPLSYLFVAASLRTFGDSAFAVRLPSVAAFFVASLAVFAVVRNRLGELLGLTAMVLVWSSGFLDFAFEARPYAMMLAFFAFAFLYWTQAKHWALGGCLTGMLLCHGFAVFLMIPFVLGEAVGQWRNKRIHRAAWLALSIPLIAIVTYIPLLVRAKGILFPPSFLPSFHRAELFYAALFLGGGPVIVILTLLVLLLRVPPQSRFLLAEAEVVFLASTFSIPLVIMGYLAWARVAFWPRYGIGAVIAFSVGIVFLLAWKSNRNIYVSAVAALVTLVGFCFQKYPLVTTHWRPQAISTAYLQIHPELPFVAASGLAFLEMDHREDPHFSDRLFYLSDKTAATKYAHATIFESLPVCKYFPVRAHMVAYEDFLKLHHHFLVFGTPHQPEDWVLDKLRDDGADIRQIAEMKTSYRDTTLYEVKFPAAVR